MAARKKAKPRAKARRGKAPARKPVARKKAAPARSKAVSRKPVARRAAPKKKAAPTRRAAPVRKPAARPAPAPAPAVQPAAPTPGPDEERAGIVTHYYRHLSVAVVRLESGSLRTGDTVHIRGHTSDFRQSVESLQIEHQPVSEVSAGQEFGLRVIDHAREHDVVYKVTAAKP